MIFAGAVTGTRLVPAPPPRSRSRRWLLASIVSGTGSVVRPVPNSVRRRARTAADVRLLRLAALDRKPPKPRRIARYPSDYVPDRQINDAAAVKIDLFIVLIVLRRVETADVAIAQAQHVPDGMQSLVGDRI